MKQLWMLSEKDLIVRQLVVAVMAKAHITKEDSGYLKMKQLKRDGETGLHETTATKHHRHHLRKLQIPSNETLQK